MDIKPPLHPLHQVPPVYPARPALTVLEDAAPEDLTLEASATDEQDQPQKLTPMFAQYRSIKVDYPDALLFYRMGDFYELFFSDAETASRELQITLTSRRPGAEDPIPMCGVPYHAVKNYIAQLLDKGYKVAICEQMEDPKAAKGLVKRAVTHVLTPGTAVDEMNLDAKGHTYLGALVWDKEKRCGGFAWVDYSTGDWSGLFSKNEAELWQWVQKLAPKELLVPDLPASEFAIPKSLAMGGIQTVRLPFRAFFDRKSSIEKVLRVQGVVELGALGLSGKDELTQACGALVSYMQQTQKQDVTHLSAFSALNTGNYLIIDEITERNLEIFKTLDGRKGLGTLRHVLDQTITPMGGRLLEERLRSPWRTLQPITESQAAVGYLVSHDAVREQLRTALDSVYDMERLSTRITLNRAAPKDFVALRQSLAALPGVREALLPRSSPQRYVTAEEQSGACLPPVLLTLLKEWDDLADYAALLERSIVDNPPHLITEGGLFKQGFTEKLDEILELAEHGEKKLQALLEKEQTETGIAKLKLGYNRVFGYYFEMSRAVSASLPERFTRRQSLANAERLITPELKELEEKLLTASEERKKLEYALFQELRESLAEARPRIIFMAHLLAQIDCWQSLAHASRKNSWVCPTLHDGADISIRSGRHPVVEAVQGKAGFVPNDLFIDDQRRLLLITGPNMAGKSTVLRQTAIIAILAQIGSHVPADAACIGIVDRVFSRVGASDNLSQGQSTFMVEMMETARILRQVTPKSLVILDEIGRGTSTFDGMALAWAVVEELIKRGKGSIRTLFATHYHELTALEGRLPTLHNMNIAVRETGGEILFLRRLVPGPADRSYGIEVARLAGVPHPVVQRARQILETLEKSRSFTRKQETATAMQQLLPGVNMPEPEPELTQAPVVAEAAAEHPLVRSLQDIDLNHLTPMQAFERLSEWKLLWGGSTQ